MPELRLLVVGAGAIGGVIAAKLTRAGYDVTALDANRAHVERMRSPGLALQDLGHTCQVPIRAEYEADALDRRFDFAVVTVKAPYLQTALTPLVEADLVDTYVALGNGLVQHRLGRLVGKDRLVVGTVEWGATNLGPGHIAQTTRAPFVIGTHDARTRALCEVLEHVAEVRVAADIAGQIWSKLLVNSTFSGLGAITGLLYGQIADSAVGRRVALGLWTEGFDVARACGATLDQVLGVHPEQLVVRSAEDVPTAEEALRILMSAAAATKASMLQDLERGAVTEVDDINGGVVREGARVGLPTPLNQCVVDLVHDCEHGRRQPEPAALDLVGELVAPLYSWSLQERGQVDACASPSRPEQAKGNPDGD
jgi:2-dehydropantoate 2-reductase